MKVAVQNRKASFHYQFIETFEAGIALQGSEVKSLREGKASLGDAYAIIKNEEAYLLNCHISPYSPAAAANHDPLRTRKLLMHKAEILRLIGKLNVKGLTLIPTKIYFKGGRVKVELALGQGKKLFDKRESLKKKEARKTMARAMKHKNQ